MKNLMNLNDVNNKIIVIRNQNVILDSDVADLYGVETMHINQAVKNNSDKFPKGYILELSKMEKQEVIKNFDNLKIKLSPTLPEREVTTKCGNPKLKFSPALPKAFTEKGLYMLATILKSPQATQTTIEIVEAFAKLREAASNLAVLNSIEEIEEVEPEIIERTGNIISDLLFSELPTASAETSFEVNLGLMKLKRSIKSEKPIHQDEIAEIKQMIKQMQEQMKLN